MKLIKMKKPKLNYIAMNKTHHEFKNNFQQKSVYFFKFFMQKFAVDIFAWCLQTNFDPWKDFEVRLEKCEMTYTVQKCENRSKIRNRKRSQNH